MIDAAAASIPALVVFYRLDARFLPRNAGRYALCLKSVSVPVCVIATISDHSLRLEIGRVDHDRLRRSASGGQSFHYAEENAPLAPSLSPVVERLGRTILPRCIAPAQSVAIYEDNAARHP